MTKTTTKNTNTNMTLDTVEGIKQAIATCTVSTTKAILEALLQAKQKEIELATKLATKKNTVSKFTEDESILKAIFIALRPYIKTDKYDCTATIAFQTVLKTINVQFTKDLQERFFSTSILHCAKSNMNKATDRQAALDSYGESVKQATRLLPLINADTWDKWYIDMKEAKTRADKK